MHLQICGIKALRAKGMVWQALKPGMGLVGGRNSKKASEIGIREQGERDGNASAGEGSSPVMQGLQGHAEGLDFILKVM